MTSWPKDKVPKRNSQGDRWREHQLVRFVSFIFFSCLKKTWPLLKWHLIYPHPSSNISTNFIFSPVFPFLSSQAFQLPRQDLALAYCRYVEPQNHTSYQDFVAARNGIIIHRGKKKFNLGPFSWIYHLNVFLFYYPRHCARHRLRQRNQHSCPGLWSFHFFKFYFPTVVIARYYSVKC